MAILIWGESRTCTIKLHNYYNALLCNIRIVGRKVLRYFAGMHASSRAFFVTFGRWFFFSALAFFLVAGLPAKAGSQVAVVKDGDQFQLMVNGKAFFIRGAGGTHRLSDLHELGGNSIRTWGIESLAEQVDGKPLLDRAQDLGIMVTAGIWVQQQRKGFDYDDAAAVGKQRDAVRAAVKAYKDHPALLIWGLGNEMEGPTSDGSDLRVWKELNILAGIIKEEDPNHPVMTVIAGYGGVKIKNLIAYCPNIDILGVNAYGAAAGAGGAVVQQGWTKPFILTEFGPTGQWEVPKTSWGAPIEATANQKAASYYATQQMVMGDSKNICLGSYAFLWGDKQEATSTWYGMFLKSGERLPQADAMSFAWTGNWPANRCPKLKAITTSVTEKAVAPGTASQASVEAVDPGGNPLQYEWSVVEENTTVGVGGDAEAVPRSHPECMTGPSDKTLAFTTPSTPGAYRLFLTIRNGKGGATTANVPFLVQ